MGQDQVSGGVSVLCWLAAPVAYQVIGPGSLVRYLGKSEKTTLHMHKLIAFPTKEDYFAYAQVDCISNKRRLSRGFRKRYITEEQLEETYQNMFRVIFLL